MLGVFVDIGWVERHLFTALLAFSSFMSNFKHTQRSWEEILEVEVGFELDFDISEIYEHLVAFMTSNGGGGVLMVAED